MKKLLLVIFILRFTSNLYPQQAGTFTDKRDGKVYKTVKIGNQTWLAENLDVDKFRNGDLIPEAKIDEEWIKAGEGKKPAWCYYNNDPTNGKKYGKLYNWHAVSDKRGLAPKGWHAPTSNEFDTLAADVGNYGNALKAKGQGFGDGAGINSVGFSALLAGFRSQGGTFGSLEKTAYFWSSTQYNPNYADHMELVYGNSYVGWLPNGNKDDGFSVRCIKD